VLGYDPKRHIITLPWYWHHADGRNELWRVSAKSLLNDGKQPPFAGFKPGLYHGHALDPAKPALLVEGEIDALTALQEAGELIVPVATGGAASGREASWLGRLSRLPLVLVAFDNDRAGDQGAAWWVDQLPNARRLRPVVGVKDVLLTIVSTADLIGLALDLGLKYDITAYDASYAVLAQQLIEKTDRLQTIVGMSLAVRGLRTGHPGHLRQGTAPTNWYDF
jgi:hypothetical protein